MRKEVLQQIIGLLGREAVLTSRVDLMSYAYDAYLEAATPEVVVFPTSTRQVAEIVRLANSEKIPFTARGAGTNLTGGCIPRQGGILLEMSRMNQILEIDLPNLRAVVQPGLVNLELSKALAPLGYYFIPDPASQKASTIGGNVGENAGGPHCLKYGVMTNHVLGLEVVMPDGEVLECGGKAVDPPGFDLTGIMVGSEGTLGIVTAVVVRIAHLPEAARTLLAIYDAVEDASRTVSAIIAAGMLPAALELMDRNAIAAVEASVQAGYPLDAAAVLIIELDGLADGLDRQSGEIEAICQANRAREVRVSRSAAERDRLWAGRRGAFGAVARLAPNYLVADGTVPRTKLPEVLRRVEEVGQAYGLSIANVFHAGDGNLHPLILFDSRNKEQTARVLQAGMDILRTCAAVGGTVSGEHGIGLEKREALALVYTPTEVDAMRSVKNVFDPAGLCNPEKIFPPDDVEGRAVEEGA